MDALFIDVTPEKEKYIRGLRAWTQTSDELLVRAEIQRLEMISALNRHGTREQFGLPPECEEGDHKELLMRHYIQSGRIKEIGMMFDLAFSRDNVHGTNMCCGCEVKSLPAELRVAVLMAHLELLLDVWRRFPEEYREVFGLGT